jgi:hypothetical protein
MKNHGTPYPCTIGQFATISKNLTVALPRAMQLSGLDVKTILKYTDEEGERLSLALAEAIKLLYNGHVATLPSYDVIDCDASPFVPSGWKADEHHAGGQLKFAASPINLYLSATQKKGGIEGNKLRKELASKPVLNANVLDYLLAHTELIPEDWKGKYVFFWGTVYRYSDRNLYVRCLCWFDGGWGWGSNLLDGDWRDDFPAALRAS